MRHLNFTSSGTLAIKNSNQLDLRRWDTRWLILRLVNSRGSSKSSGRGPIATGIPKTPSAVMKCSTMSCCTGSPALGRHRPGCTGKASVRLAVVRLSLFHLVSPPSRKRSSDHLGRGARTRTKSRTGQICPEVDISQPSSSRKCLSTTCEHVSARCAHRSDDLVGASAPVAVAEEALIQLAGRKSWQLSLIIDGAWNLLA